MAKSPKPTPNVSHSRDRSRDRDRARGTDARLSTKSPLGNETSEPNPVPQPADTTQIPERLTLRKAEAARALGVSERKLHDLLMDGEIPHIKLSRVVLIPVEGIRAFISARSQNGGQA